MIVIVLGKLNYYINADFSNFIAISNNGTQMFTDFMQAGTNNTPCWLIITIIYRFMPNSAKCHIYITKPNFLILFHLFYNMLKAKDRYTKLLQFYFAFNRNQNCWPPLISGSLFFSKWFSFISQQKNVFSCILINNSTSFLRRSIFLSFKYFSSGILYIFKYCQWSNISTWTTNISIDFAVLINGFNH